MTWLPVNQGRYSTVSRGAKFARSVGGDPQGVVQNQNLVLTELALGRSQRRQMLGQQIMRTIQVQQIWFEYMRVPNDHLVHVDTRRPMRAEYATRDWTPTYESDRVQRYGLATMRDVDEYRNADNWLDLASRDAALAGAGVELDLELARRDLLITAANYPAGHVTTLAANSEFNHPTNGDARTALRAASAPIRTAFNLGFEDIGVAFTRVTADAAMEDPVLKAAKVNTSILAPTAAELATYYGFGEVVIGDVIVATDAGSVPASAYGDVAILYAIDGSPEFDTTHGEETWFAEFTFNSGVASTPFTQNNPTATYYPWDAYAKPKLINASRGALVLNCSTEV